MKAAHQLEIFEKLYQELLATGELVGAPAVSAVKANLPCATSPASAGDREHRNPSAFSP